MSARTIGTGGNHIDVNAWVVWVLAQETTFTEIHTGSIISDVQFTTDQVINGATTSDEFYWHLTSSKKHYGIPGAGWKITGYDDNYEQSGYVRTFINNRDDYTIIDWLEIDGKCLYRSGTVNGIYIEDNCENAMARYNIIHSLYNSSTSYVSGINLRTIHTPLAHSNFVFDIKSVERDSVITSGTSEAPADPNVLTDTTKNFTTIGGMTVGRTIRNLTDGSEGLVESYTATTVTTTLYNGTGNTWGVGDSYEIVALSRTFGIYNLYNGAVTYNNSIFDCDMPHAGTKRGCGVLTSDYDTIIIKNNIALDNNIDFVYPASSKNRTGFNYSSDSTAPGDNSRTGESALSTFMSVKKQVNGYVTTTDATGQTMTDSNASFLTSGAAIGDKVINFGDSGSIGYIESIDSDTQITLALTQLLNGTATAIGTTVLTDSGADFVNDQVKNGMIIRNLTDGSEGTITSKTATTITAVLTGGTANAWAVDDVYEVVSYLIYGNSNFWDSGVLSCSYVIIIVKDGEVNLHLKNNANAISTGIGPRYKLQEDSLKASTISTAAYINDTSNIYIGNMYCNVTRDEMRVIEHVSFTPSKYITYDTQAAITGQTSGDIYVIYDSYANRSSRVNEFIISDIDDMLRIADSVKCDIGADNITSDQPAYVGNTSDFFATLTDDGLEMAIYLSIFTDRRITFESGEPETKNDRRGWWGDNLLEDNDLHGSLLWTMQHKKIIIPDTLNETNEIIEEALEWLVSSGVAEEITVESYRLENDLIGIEIIVKKPDNIDVLKYQYVWDNYTNSLAN